MIETRKGGCLCGAVRFEADLTKREFGACHCEMCRRWTGSALLGITVPTGNVRWTGEEHIATRQTSSWAMRAWCRDCGSNSISGLPPTANGRAIPNCRSACSTMRTG